MLGTYVGHYRIVRLLGKGGMGEVYEAINDPLERRVAIKVLHPEYARDPDIVSRFFKEARAVNIVHHPGLVQISEFGSLPSGSAYLIMEYLDGETLSGRLRQRGGVMHEREVLLIARQLASSLAATHARGIIHRDLKPGNIMLVADPAMPGGERVKLLDFGIAKLVSSDADQPGAPRTRTGLLMGTPIYMSPEQCRGAGLVNDRSDVYSLAVIMYQLLAGRPPFIGDGDGMLIAAHLLDTPPPLAELAPQTSPGLCELVHRMLLKDKAPRPSMEEVASQLEVLERGELQVMTHSQPPSTGAHHSAATTMMPVLGNNPTTLRQTAGQKGLLLVERKSPVPKIAGIGLLLATAGAAIVVTQLGKNPTPVSDGSMAAIAAAQPPQKTVPAPGSVNVAAKIHWAITSTPPGAEVLDSATQRSLGKTPWQTERDSGEGTSELTLRAPGFREQRVSVHNDQNGVWQLMLAPQSPRGAPRAGATTASSPAKTVAAAPPKVNPCPTDPLCRGRAERGMSLYSEARYQDALREFQAAYALAQSAPRLLIHIGLCMTQLGLPKKALTYYRSFEKEQPNSDAATKKLLRQYVAEANSAASKP